MSRWRMMARCLAVAATIAASGLAAAQSIEDVEAPPPPAWTPGETIGLTDDDVSATLELLEPAPATGLPIRLRLVVPEGADARVAVEGFDDDGPFALLGVAGENPIASDLVATISLRTFASGATVLPGFTVRVGDADLAVPARTIEVESIAGLETDPAAHRDIADAVPMPSGKGGWTIEIILGILAVAGVVALIAWWLRRPRPTPPPIPADEWALARLDELEARGPMTPAGLHAFYIELTDITRRFIERRFGLAAPERTTPEFIREAGRHPGIREDQAALLGRLLRAADMVKFAGDRPSIPEATRHLAVVRDFVRDAGSGDPESPDGEARGRRIAGAVEGLDRLEDES